LTSLEGTGVSQAKAFTTLLTQVGFNISEAMKTMQESNKEIQALHVSLAEVEKEIEENNVETVTPDEVSK
jgi:hypothetical protein